MSKIRIYDIRKHDFGSLYYQEILRLQILVANLDDQGIDIEIINRNRDPEAFASEPAVAALQAEMGDKGFPCVVRDGVVMMTRKYPKNEEVLELLQHDGTFFSLESAREDMSDIN